MSRVHHTLLLLLIGSANALAGGHAFNENFSVLTPSRESLPATEAYAQRVLVRAEEYRREIAREWLGEELPEGVGRTQINVAFSPSQDQGLTWARDNLRRRMHTLFLKTSPEGAFGATLKHEMCHVVFATRFPLEQRLPVWLEEGIASRYDDELRIDLRVKLLRWWEQTGNWPEIRRVVQAEQLSATDRVGYTVAASLVEFLLNSSDKDTLLRFASAARSDLAAALQSHYQIQDLADLEVRWQRWAESQQSR